MAVSPDIAKDIISFRPVEPGPVGQRVGVGVVDQDTELIYDLQRYQRRNVYLPGEPKLAGEYTTQPGLGLLQRTSEGREIRIPLIYRSDVKALGDTRAMRIWYAVTTARCLKI